MLASKLPLTPALSRVREREQEQQRVSSPRSHTREQEQEQQQVSSPLSRTRERVRVRARALRGNQTAAEALLWSRLRSNQLLNLKFRRQRPIGPYFADFVCMEVRLVIELDGGQHADAHAQNHDAERGRFMSDLGYQTLRFWNHDMLSDTEAVMARIWQVATALSATQSAPTSTPI
jgi:very-short-patch-repair endonuclease